MSDFQTVDATVAQEVQTSIQRHLWYLTEQLVVLALFDTGVADEVRSAMATKLLNIRRPRRPIMPAPPTFPLITPQTTLDTLIGPKSWLLFNLLGSNAAWLVLPPNQWQLNADYIRMSATVRHLAVVNDAAERAVKDIQDYAEMARDGPYRGDMIITTNDHRIRIPEFLKNAMENDI